MAKQKEWQLVHCFVDVGLSGATLQRLALLDLIKEIEARNVNGVVVKQFSSLSRNFEITSFLLEIFQRKGVTVYEFPNGSLDAVSPDPIKFHSFIHSLV